MKYTHMLSVVSSTEISRHHRLFYCYFININELLFSSKIGTHDEMYELSRMYWKKAKVGRQLTFNALVAHNVLAVS